MANSKVYLEKIANWSPLNENEANELLTVHAPLRINFGSHHSALLDTAHPRAALWAKTIDLLKKHNQLVYVEVDAATEVITGLYVPVATRVLGILSGDE